MVFNLHRFVGMTFKFFFPIISFKFSCFQSLSGIYHSFSIWERRREKKGKEKQILVSISITIYAFLLSLSPLVCERRYWPHCSAIACTLHDDPRIFSFVFHKNSVPFSYTLSRKGDARITGESDKLIYVILLFFPLIDLEQNNHNRETGLCCVDVRPFSTFFFFFVTDFAWQRKMKVLLLTA